LLEDAKLIAIGKKYGKVGVRVCVCVCKHNAPIQTPAQVALRWQLQRDVVIIPKSITKDRIVSNIDVFDFKLSDEDMKTVDALDSNMRICDLTRDIECKHYPFHEKY
jgi:diketogulonate reductase-like aldo/keto reductase